MYNNCKKRNVMPRDKIFFAKDILKYFSDGIADLSRVPLKTNIVATNNGRFSATACNMDRFLKFVRISFVVGTTNK